MKIVFASLLQSVVFVYLLVNSIYHMFIIFTYNKLIFVRIYWLLYVTWRISPNSYHACVDICPVITSVEKKQGQLERSFDFSSLSFYVQGKYELVLKRC